jgi:ketosteroid isomerase-like protein
VSQENVKLVRSLCESGLIDRDPEELLELATPDVEYVNPAYAVEPGVRHGLVAVAQAMRGFAEVWEESRHELRELYDRGDVVVAAVSWHVRSRGSERSSSTKRHTLRAGRIARFEWGQDLGTALEAAGASGMRSSPRRHGPLRGGSECSLPPRGSVSRRPRPRRARRPRTQGARCLRE